MAMFALSQNARAQDSGDSWRIPSEKGRFHVFLLMGQSNMAGYGQLQPGDEKPIAGALMLRGWKPEEYKWEPARHPIHNRLDSDQFGLGGPFAQAYRDAHPGVTVGLIPVAWGGAPISQLNKGTDAYADAIAKAKLAKEKGVLKGVLWHQGESDTVEPGDAEAYAGRLKKLALDIRSDLGEPDLPFIAGNLAEFYGTGREHDASDRVARINQVRAALRDLPNRVSHAAFVESAGLGSHDQNKVHFDRDSLIVFGRRYAAAYATLDMRPEPDRDKARRPDWLLDGSAYKAGVYQSKRADEIVLSNGLVRRTFRLAPNAATVGLDNLATGEAILRGVKPEAMVEIDGVPYEIGGLKGQPNYAFLRPEWIDDLKAAPAAFQFAGFEIGKPKERLGWKQVRHHAPNLKWPPDGVYLRMDYRMPAPTAEVLTGGAPQPSDLGRKQLIADDFKTLDKVWKVHASKANPRSSFENEGKVGEIYTPENTCVFVERPLPPETRIVEATIDAGTDKSASWGPGIALVWPNRAIKFNLRPGGHQDNPGVPSFGAWDGAGAYPEVGGRLKLDLNQPWTLRLRLEEGAVLCEAKPQGGGWKTYGTFRVDPSLGAPAALRVGKMDLSGGAEDFGDAGELVRLRVLRFAAYGAMDAAALAALSREMEGKRQVCVSVHYELYDGLPVFSKWITVHNNGAAAVTVNRFTSEILAAVEYGSAVESREYGVQAPNIHVDTDYAFASFNAEDANHQAVHWEADPDYETQVNYQRLTPCLLQVGPGIGPGQEIAAGGSFDSFHAFVLPYDSYDRERNGLALRRMYRTIAPWITENPLMMHARFADWDRVKLAIDQCAEVGFEMVILTFGSGFDLEDESEPNLARARQLADYARGKGIEIGTYSLLASRSVGGGNDVVMPAGKSPTFGNSPCIGSKWGQNYFRKLRQFYEKTGFRLLEHDGSYPGDVCAATDHPGHRGLEDSQWTQWRTISDFYKWCRANGVFLNVPDYYYLNGSNKCGMGYRETNWSLPREQQVIHTRQNIYDGTWEKTPSMGWMFVPLTEYHGGGAAATIEPLNEHLDHYEKMIVSNLGAGVQACYRGPRLYDTDDTKAMVKKWVDFFKKHREILESDIIHLRRADGRDIDYFLHVNPAGKEKAMLVAFNPLRETVSRTIQVPLYYSGLTQTVRIREQEGAARKYALARDHSVTLQVRVPPEGMTWFVVE
jgi:hypothetical protein